MNGASGGGHIVILTDLEVSSVHPPQNNRLKRVSATKNSTKTFYKEF